MYSTTQFGSITLPHVNPVQEQGRGPARTAVIDLPGGAIFDAHGADPSPVGSQNWPYSFTLIGTDAVIHALHIALRAAVGTSDTLWRQSYATGGNESCPARMDGLVAVRKVGDRYHLDADLQFTLLSEVWAGDQHTTEIVDPWDDGDDLPTLGAEGLAPGDPVSLHVHNDGNKPQREMVITLTARGGSATALVITSLTTGHILAWDGTLLEDDSLVIDTGDLTVLNDGVGDYAGLTEPSDKEHWMEIAEGLNIWSVEVTGTDYELLVEHPDAWA